MRNSDGDRTGPWSPRRAARTAIVWVVRYLILVPRVHAHKSVARLVGPGAKYIPLFDTLMGSTDPGIFKPHGSAPQSAQIVARSSVVPQCHRTRTHQRQWGSLKVTTC